MKIDTTRFGAVAIEACDVIHFPGALAGLDGCLDWVLLADAHNDKLAWLQCTTRAEIALAVVSPRRFVPDYQVRVTRNDLAAVALKPEEQICVLAIVNKHDRSITLNLKAPLLINFERRVGRQVISGGDQSLQFELNCDESSKKKIA